MQGFEREAVLAAIAETVAMGQRQFQRKFPGQSFEAMRWDINSLQSRNIGRRSFLNFTCRGDLKQEIPDPHYVNLAKSWLLLHAKSIGRMTHRLTGLQVLWEVLSSEQDDDDPDGSLPSFPWWEHLCKPLISEVEYRMRDLWATGSRICEHLHYVLEFIHFLEQRQICFNRVEYEPVTPYAWRKEEGTEATSANPEGEATKKLFSEQAIKGLGQLYRTVTDPADFLLLSIVIIVLLTGLRIGEVLSLPEQCIVRKQNQQGDEEYALRFYEEKKHPGQMLALKPLLPNTVELILQVVNDVKKMTAPWRQQAVVLENNPGRVPLPGFENQQLIESRELAALLGFEQRADKFHYHLRRWVEQGHLPQPKQSDDRFFYFSVPEVEQFLAEHLLDQLWTVNLKTGKHQLLSQTLFIVPRHFMSKRWNISPLIIYPVGYSQVYFFLSGSKTTRSVFERYNICETDGTLCQVRTQQARTTIVTIAHEGGASLDDIARWIGHRNPQTTKDNYLVPSQLKSLSWRDRVQQMHEAVRQGRVNHTIARLYQSLPPEEREVFLQAELLVIHVTQWHYCKRNFVAGCDRYLFCPGCPDQIEMEGSDTESLQQIQEGLQLSWQEAERQAMALGGQIAEPQLRLWQQMANYVDASLSSQEVSTSLG